MSQQSQGTNSSPADLPMKRKRGRPRKDESLVQGENINVMPGSDSARKNKPSADSAGTSEKVEDEMVGQVVSGVIEGSFDAGYLLNVRVADTDTQLRGVVFLPGRFIPITQANDVAPNVTMIQRKEIPIPACNTQTPPGSSSQSNQSKKQHVELRNVGPVFPGQFPPSELQSAVQIASEKQPASVMAPPADILPKHDTGLPLGGTAMPKQISQSGFEISQSIQNNTQALELKSNVPILTEKVPALELQSGTPPTLDKQTTSVVVPLPENLPKNDTGALDGKVIPQQTSESRLEIPPPEHGDKQFVVLKDHTPVFPGQVPGVEIQSATPMALDNQSASVVVPLADNLTKSDRGPSLEGGVVLQQTSESTLEIPPSGSNQPVELKTQGIFPNQVPPFELQSAVPMEPDNQCTSVIVPLVDNSAENDTGPSLEGKALPQQTLEPGFETPPLIQNNTLAVELNSNAPMLPVQVPFFGLQSDTPTTVDKQPTSVVVHLAGNMPENNTDPSLEGKFVSQKILESGVEIRPIEQGNKQCLDQVPLFEVQSAIPMALDNQSAYSSKNDRGPCLEAKAIPQQSLLSGLGNQSAQVMAQLKYDKVVEQDEVLQDIESSDLIKSPSIHVDATKDLESERASEPSADMLPVTGHVSQVPEVQNDGVGSDLKLNALNHEEVKKPNIELSVPENSESELTVQSSTVEGISQTNEKPAEDAIKVTEVGTI